MKSIILGNDDAYELSDFDDGFPVMVWHFAVWLGFFADFDLAKKSLSSKQTRKNDLCHFFSQFFVNVDSQG